MKNLAIDCETDLISAGRLAPKLACITFKETGTDNFPEIYAPKEGITRLKDWINEGSGWLVGHNIAYDMYVILRESPTLAPFIWTLYDQGRVWDTGLHERLYTLGAGWSVHPSIGKPIVTGGVTLAQLALGLVGIDYGDTKTSKTSPRMHYGELIGVPVEKYPHSAREYALLDARVTLAVFEYQMERLLETKWREEISRGFGKTYELPSQTLQVQSAWALHHLGAWGLKTTSEKYKQWHENLDKELLPLTEKLKTQGLLKGEKNTKDMKKIRDRIERAYGSKAPKTAKGTVQTSTEVLSESNDPVLESLAKWMELEKLRSSFGSVLESAVQYTLSPKWNTLVRSGRTSCTKPNLQQLPRSGGIRESFTPRAGYVYVGADYSTAELIALARVCEEMGLQSKMAEAIRRGLDLHLALASQIRNISYEEAKIRLEQGDSEIKKYRQLAKVPNFGLPGGLGVDGLIGFAKTAYNLTISKKEARSLKDNWFKQWSEMADYFRNIEKATARGYIIQSFTKRRRGAIGYTDGANTMFQGLIADGAKKALYNVVKACWIEKDSPLYGSKPVLFIHDEIIIESPIGKEAQAGDELSRIMIESMKPCLPNFPVQVDAWVSNVWSKENQTMRDEAGRLINCSKAIY